MCQEYHIVYCMPAHSILQYSICFFHPRKPHTLLILHEKPAKNTSQEKSKNGNEEVGVSTFSSYTYYDSSSILREFRVTVDLILKSD